VGKSEWGTLRAGEDGGAFRPTIQRNRIAVIDFETTGLSPQQGARAIEIAAVLVSEGRVVDRFSSLMNPGVRVPSFITQLTGITDDMVSSAPQAASVMRDVRNFIGDADLVAHNASFDSGFMRSELALAGVAMPLNFACTMLLARRIFPEAPNHKLGTLVQHLKLPNNGNFHRALADAEVTAELLFRIQSEISARYMLADVSHHCMARIQTTAYKDLKRTLQSLRRKGDSQNI
jgi:DNA polymerase-3 subunit epsilon